MSGDFRGTGSFTPSVALSPDANRRWLKRTTASPPIAPAAKQIATRCITVIPRSVSFHSFSVMFVSMTKTPFDYQRPTREPPSTCSPLTASGSGGLRSAALGFLQVSFRPPSPALGHPGDREEAPDLLPVEGVDAEDVADGEVVVGALSDLNLVP